MLITKFISIFIAFITAAASLLSAPPTREARCAPVFTGTFLQSWYSCSWDDARWQAEITAMKDAGIKYLILQDTATKAARSIGAQWSVYYNSSLEDFENAVFSDNDVIENALRHCSGTGIKVFVGLNMFEDFWVEGALTRQYKEACALACDMAREIHSRYYSKYPDAFAGWYFTPEVNNMLICRLNLCGIASGLNSLIAEIDRLNPELPLMLSPFSSDYLSAGSLDALNCWVTLLGLTNFRDGDIFAPQDAVGARWAKEKNLRRNWEIYRAAVDSCNAKVKLWANCENFDIPIPATFGSGIITRPPTENIIYTAATLDRFTGQMKLASEYCENIITFSYSHYYSPNAASSVYMQTYKDYLANSCTLESEPPCAVPDFYKGEYDGNVLLTWSVPQDNFGIAYYRICKDGRFLTRVECCFGDNLNQYYDLNASIDSEYSIVAYDAAGNASPASIAV